MSKQDEIAIILQQELHSADQMPLLIICVMSKLLIWGYSLEPSLFVWPISEVVPHDWLTIFLSSWESSTIPSWLSVKIPAIIINHKVTITLNDHGVLVTTCTRCPHCLTVLAVHYQVSIFLHDEIFRSSLPDERLTCPKIVNESILMFLYDEISIALESQLVLAARMVNAFITSLNNYLLIPVVWILLQICY